MSSLWSARHRVLLRPSCRCGLAAASFLLVWATVSACQTQSRDVLCSGGVGSVDAEFRTGIKVHAGAARSGRLATRTCAARLSWEKQELIVATDASQLDVDGFGVDSGVGVPVAACQMKKSNS